ncbi:HAD domain-containing protein [Cupriavidus oxalaticus]
MHSPDRIHLFLNFEGVLVERGGASVSGTSLVPTSGVLWRWAEPLIELAKKFDLALVIRSSWALQLPVNGIIAAMPPELGERVVGATDPIAELRSSGAIRIASQFAVIERYVRKFGLSRWCAVDDREECWLAEDHWRFVLTNPSRGLGDRTTCDHLERVLIRLAEPGPAGAA